jgi:hypothetical protein
MILPPPATPPLRAFAAPGVFGTAVRNARCTLTTEKTRIWTMKSTHGIAAAVAVPALNNLFEIRAGEIACTKATTPAIATSRNA